MTAARRPKAHPLLLTLRREFSALADADRAKAQQAYMKSEMPYYGIPSTPMRHVCKRVFASRKFQDASEWREAVLAIWRDARYREERYAAIELTGIRAAKPYQTLDALPMYEEMIVSGAWWDYVDTIATHRIGGLLRAFPDPMRQTMLDWSLSGDMWKRRTAIICQLQFKKDTDRKLLYACIEPAIASKEFFLRKAIGWALRQYARDAEDEVLRYVEANRDRLSPLSKREALKSQLRSGQLDEVP